MPPPRVRDLPYPSFTPHPTHTPRTRHLHRRGGYGSFQGSWEGVTVSVRRVGKRRLSGGEERGEGGGEGERRGGWSRLDWFSD